MIKLEKDEACLTDETLLVVTGGEYKDDDLVEVYKINNSEQIVSYHALYIKEGRFPE